MFSKVRKFLEQYFCSHLFDPPDMEPRDERGMVRWPCCKCGLMFEAEYGLLILYGNQCTGRWGIGKQNDHKN